MRVEVKRVSNLRRFAPDKMQKVSVFATSRLFQDVYCLEPGQAQKPHAHDGSDKTYLVLEGRGLFRVGADEREVLPGEAVMAPAAVEHGVSNPGPDRLVVLVTMAPPPPHV